MKTQPKPLTPSASAAADKFLEHLVTCGHCQSFPRSLCQTGAVLQRKASQERMQTNANASNPSQGERRNAGG
jgi:hypothetical protein